MHIPARPRLSQRLWALVLVTTLGCSDGAPADDGPDGLSETPVPVGGTIKLNGEPLAHAVVTFLPATGPAVGTGETDREGKYTLSSMGRPGLPAGDYKVAVSYLVSAEGEPQGLGPRGSLVQPPGMLTAKEQLPPEYADLGRTKLSAKVSSEGASFDFDVKADVKPAEKIPAAGNPELKKEVAEKSPTKPAPKETHE